MELHTYAAQDIGSPLKPFDTSVSLDAKNDIVIRVTHCGICHSDIHMIDNDWHMSNYPLVPGHEVVGEVVETGSEIQHLSVGDRVGVGWQRSSCLHCEDCLNGDENLCNETKSLIGDGFGGFADKLVVDGRFAFVLPDAIESRHAGPLM